MRSVQYGTRTIDYSVVEHAGLKSHYISVDRQAGVVLKGSSVAPEKADQLILKKAGWIMQKLQIIGGVEPDQIVTGSRLPYLGKHYYVELLTDPSIKGVEIAFNFSKFTITVPHGDTDQQSILAALDEFYKAKCVEKMVPRVRKLSERTGLSYSSLSFLKMGKRWGSCTPENKIILNTEAIKLPWTLIDYLIIHELCHTEVKDHSKEFWALLSRYESKWKALDERMAGWQL